MSFNLLIPSAGMRYMHIKLFKESRGVDRVVTTEIKDVAPGIFSADVCYRVPPAISREYPDVIMNICEIENINAIVPLLDLDIAVFSEIRERFEERGIRLLLSPKKTIDIAMDKLTTANFLLENGLPAPITIKASDWERNLEKIDPPLIIKPRFPSKRSEKGYDISIISDNDGIKSFLDSVGDNASDYVFQEYLVGTGLTVDFFCDKSGKLISAVPGERLVALSKVFSKSGGGIMSEGKIIHDEEIQQIVRKLTNKMHFYGTGNFQAYRLPTGDIKIIEINPRMVGATVMTNASGRPFFQWSIDLLIGKEIDSPNEDYREVRMTSWIHPIFFEDNKIIEI